MRTSSAVALLVGALASCVSQSQEVMVKSTAASAREVARVVEAARSVSMIAAVLCDGRCGAVMIVADPEVGADVATARTVGPYAEIHFDPPSLSRASSQLISGAFAHEWGHILAEAWGEPEDTPRRVKELNADTWAGCILALASIPHAELMSFLEPGVRSASYPSGFDRARAVDEGARACTPR